MGELHLFFFASQKYKAMNEKGETLMKSPFVVSLLSIIPGFRFLYIEEIQNWICNMGLFADLYCHLFILDE